MFVYNKEKGKDFKVLNLTDPQLNDWDWEQEHPVKMLKKTVDELIERVKPDIITITGDLAFFECPEAYRKLCEYIDGFGIPWHPVFGNHDNQGGPEYIKPVVEIFKDFKHLCFEEGDPRFGCGNYLISIEEEGTPRLSLIMADSHDRESYETQPDERFWYDGTSYREWAKLQPEQIEWISDTLTDIEKRGGKESVLMMHIPNYSYHYAADAAYREGADRANLEASRGEGFWNEGYEDSLGVVREGICSSFSGDEVLEMLLTHPSAKYIIAGHDHVNNFMITYKGIRHIYALKTGVGCYAHEDLNGGTVITVGDRITVHHEYVAIP